MSLLRKLLILLVLLATITAGVLFALQNAVLVPLDLLFHTFEARSLSLWVLAAFALGGVLGMLTASGIILRLRNAVRTTRRQLVRARAEVDTLRTAGLKDGE